MPISQILKSIISPTIALLSLLLFDSVQGQRTTVNRTTILDHTNGRTGFPPCDAIIAANLSNALHMPASPDYTSLVDAYWSSDTRKAPWCFVLPSSPSELSEVITALSPNWAGDGAGDWHIAIRSRGHSGGNSNNIADGIVIDMSLFNTTTYDAATNIASIGTGAHWQNVYETLHQHSVTVTGGRQGVVGVGGFLLGGGIGWTTPRMGFGCDTVVNYEIALANGDIINANASANPDLYRALKGGGSNYGIVTRFDLEAFPAMNVTYGTTIIGMDHIDEVIDAIAGFADLDQSFNDNAMLVDIAYSAEAQKTSILVLQVNTVDDANTTAFDAINAIPALTPPTKQSVSVPESADTDVVSSSAQNTREVE